MHKIPVADVEIDSETANILSIPRLHNIEHIPIGSGVNDWWLGLGLSDQYMDKMRIDKLLFSLKKRIEMLRVLEQIRVGIGR